MPPATPAQLQIPGIPTNAAELWARLLTEELVDVADLRREVTAYQEFIADQSKHREFVDRSTAETIAGVLLRLLKTVGPKTSGEHRRAIQAAVRYFVIKNDAEGDLESVTGFDDDVEVMNAVLRHLGLEGWVLDLD